MKSRILMAALVVTLLLGAQSFASDCCDPCGACDVGCAKSCDLFSGLKKLVACNPCSASECGPCDSVVACSPCDAVCDPCEVACDDGCSAPKFAFGKRFRGFFACNDGGCDVACDPCEAVCDVACDPCGEVACDVSCDDACRPGFRFRKFFRGFRLNGECGDGCSDPCSSACETSCDPCEAVCDVACDPCSEVSCDDGCGPKFGRLFDHPRHRVKKFFDGFRCDSNGCCETSCDPCEPVCDPCSSCCN